MSAPRKRSTALRAPWCVVLVALSHFQNGPLAQKLCACRAGRLAHARASASARCCSGCRLLIRVRHACSCAQWRRLRHLLGSHCTCKLERTWKRSKPRHKHTRRNSVLWRVSLRVRAPSSEVRARVRFPHAALCGPKLGSFCSLARGPCSCAGRAAWRARRCTLRPVSARGQRQKQRRLLVRNRKFGSLRTLPGRGGLDRIA